MTGRNHVAGTHDVATGRAPKGRGPTIRVQLLSVSGCPHVDRVRVLLRQALTGSAAVEVEEIEGRFPSPTVLVNGIDVTGRPAPTEASCRLDLPDLERIRAALQRAIDRRGA